MVSLAYLKECLEYDPASGVFLWKARPRHHFKHDYTHKRQHTRMAGQVATYSDERYLRVFINGGFIYAHRAAYALGFDIELADVPTHLDHKDTDKTNNALLNLRPATVSENASNRGRSVRNKSGFKGVSFFKRDGTYRAQIQTAGKGNRHIGYYATPEEAHVAYQREAVKLFGEFARFE